MNSILKSALAIIAGAVFLFPAATLAQVNGKNQGYLVDQDFKVVTAVGGTVCVRTSDWTPARAAAAEAVGLCDPDLAPKKPAAGAPVAPPPAPKAATPAAKPTTAPNTLVALFFSVMFCPASICLSPFQIP